MSGVWKVLSGVVAAGGLSATLTFGLAGPAFAAPVPGDNGDVKIHKDTTPPDDPRNDPKVCLFYLAAFNFDRKQLVTWSISHQPPQGGDPALSGSLTLPTGTGHTGLLSLQNGMYKLTWKFNGEHGAGKHKVFKVDCPAPTTSPSASPSTSPSTSPSASPSTSPSGSPSSSPSVSPSSSPTGHGPSASPSEKPPVGGVEAGAGGSSHAADTTESVAGAALAAAGLATGGLLLVRRRRSSR